MKLGNKHLIEIPGLSIKQNRSKRTYDALIKTGFQLLKKRDFTAITVAELSQSAGYSVGAFYARFRSKDEFFNAMVAHHFETRGVDLEHLFTTVQINVLIDELIKDIVHYYWVNQNFWRAALVRSMRDPDFWTPIRRSGHDLATRVIGILSEQNDRTLTDLEQTNIRFAFQITLGTINNTIINRPGPIFMNQRLFVEGLARAFRLVTDYDSMMKKKKRVNVKSSA
ncbi:MAG: TetR/AcrR family transcriptional regulator [Deltaproteobacteria bacterium]|nr:TetR/AcrR family transcriptional regulator [Deltaproteobacteria bacterium]